MSTPAATPHVERVHHPDGRSLAGLFTDLWRETTTLVHDELELAKADIADKAAQAGRGASAVAVGGAVAFAGFLVLLGAAVGALALVLPPETAPWLAPLIVGAVVLIVGLIMLSAGRRRLRAHSLKPDRAIESLRRDRELARGHMSAREHPHARDHAPAREHSPTKEHIS